MEEWHAAIPLGLTATAEQYVDDVVLTFIGPQDEVARVGVSHAIHLRDLLGGAGFRLAARTACASSSAVAGREVARPFRR